MRKYFILTKLQLYALYGVNKMRHAQGNDERKKARRSLFALLAMVFGLAYCSTFYSLALAQSLQATGDMDALLTVMAFAASMLLLLFSIFEAKGVLFQFQDYDIVMSWPVRVSTVAASRVTLMYVYNLVYAVLLLLPAGIIYGIGTGRGVWYYPPFLLLMLFIPALPTLIGALIGTLVALLTSRMQKKGVFGAVFQIGFAFAIMALSMRFTTGLTELADRSAQLSETAANGYPPVLWFTHAVTGAEDGFFCALLLISSAIAALLLFAWLLGKGYVGLNSRLTAVSNTKRHHRADPIFRSGRIRALYRVEWKRYVSSSIYLSNTIFGYILLVALSVVVGVIRPKAVMEFLHANEFANIRAALPFFMSWIVTMSATSASAISMEGNRLWIVKSLPVRAKEWLLAKLFVSLTPAVPSLIVCAVLLSLGLHASPAEQIWLFLTPMSFAVLAGIFGLWINSKLPKLDWKNEMEAVKQSAAVAVQVLAGMVMVALPSVPMVLMGARWILPVGTALALAVAGLFWLYLVRVGDKRLLEL